MDRKTFGIGILTITAVVLFVAQFLPVREARANDAVGDRDYQLVTSRGLKGGAASRGGGRRPTRTPTA